MREQRVLVSGAAGKMGQEVCRAVIGAAGMDLVAAVDVGERLEALKAQLPSDTFCTRDLGEAIGHARPQVMVDFTVKEACFKNVQCALEHGVRCVVGTTGLSPAQTAQLGKLSLKQKTAVFIAPNFSIGAVLMMQFAREAARFFSQAEIVELHHDQKKDAPSGTSIRTAALIREAWGQQEEAPARASRARGDAQHGVPIHSIRLQGLVAHQKVIFGGEGETLTIHHDSLDRACFMPGVLLAIRKIPSLSGLTIGLENLL